MILSFKKQFVEKILSGSKIHTIREDNRARWFRSRKIQMATGVRTKNYNCFKEAICLSVQAIHVHYFEETDNCPEVIRVIVDGIVLNDSMLEKLAINDGFEDVKAFFKWFNSDFQGKIIHWTDFKYRVEE